MRKSNIRILLLATSMLAGGQALPAAAQQAASLEEIVVTARRVEERLQEAPVAVTALTTESLERKSMEGLEDIAGQVVGFTFENYTGGLGSPTMRGMTQTRITNPVQNVATFMDGAYLQRAYMLDASLIAMARVEVVKGPQSAQYGRNAFSGAINYVTKDPGTTPSATVSATLGTDKRREYGFSVDGPIIAGKLRGLLAAGHSEFDGTWKNNHPLANAPGVNTRGKLGGAEKDAYMGKLVFTPIDPLEITLSYAKTKIDIEVQPSYAMATSGTTLPYNSVNCSPLPNVGTTTGVQNRLFCGKLTTTPVIAAGSPRIPGLVVDPRSFGARGDTEVKIAKVRYNFTENLTGSYQYSHTFSDVTSRGGGGYDPMQPAINARDFALLPPALQQTFALYLNNVTTDSQPNGYLESDQHEVRFNYDRGDLRLAAGANYWDVETAEIAGTEIARPNTLETFVFLSKFNDLVRTEEGKSAFASAEYAFTDKFKMGVEGRWTQETQGLVDFNAAPVNRNTPRGYRQSKDFKYFTPRVSADYKLTPDNLIYASIAKGVKAGGFNGGPYFFASQCPANPTAATCPNGLNLGQQSYDPETNWTYEFGSKNEFFNRTLRLNVSVYYVDWTKLQINVARLDSGIVPGLAQPLVTGNIGGVNVKGIEIEGSWLATQNLRFDYGFGYVQSQYADGSISIRFRNTQSCDGVVCPVGTPTSGGDISGKQQERGPSTEASFGAEYNATLPNDWEWFVRGDLDYRSRQYVDEYNLAYAPGRTLLNFRAGLTIDRYSIQGWVKNVLDEEYVSNAVFTLGTGGARTVGYTPIFGEKRTAGVTVKATF